MNLLITPFLRFKTLKREVIWRRLTPVLKFVRKVTTLSSCKELFKHQVQCKRVTRFLLNDKGYCEDGHGDRGWWILAAHNRDEQAEWPE